MTTPIRKYSILILLSGLVAACSPIHYFAGSDVDSVQPLTKTGELDDHCVFYLDESKQLSLKEVAQSDNLDWQVPGFTALNFGWTQGAAFIRCLVQNTSDATKTFKIHNDWPVMDSWQLTYKKPDGTYYFGETGDHFPFSERPEPRQWAFHFSVDLAPQKPTVLYMRLHSTRPLAVPIFLLEEAEWIEYLSTTSGGVLGLLGALFFCFLLNILLYVILRDNRFFYYLGFLISFTIFALTYTGMANLYLWGDYVGLNQELQGITAGLFTYFLTQFGIHWFRGIGFWPIAGLRVASYIGLAAAALELFVDFWPILIANMNGFLILLVSPTILIAVIKRKWPLGIIWIVAVGGFFYALVPWIVLLSGFIPPMYWLYFDLLIGANFCTLVLTIALPSQVKALQIEMQGLNKELSQSLAEVNALHEQQKGDYMLTSNLLTPFQKSAEPSATTSTTFYLRQYNQFSFKEKPNEIGGDLCLSERFELGEKPFTFFVNGDAMGKSLQGAGGAIVLAAAIESYLSQTRTGKIDIDIPELWLRGLYENLQELFLSFEGAMLLSLVMGLVDEECSVFYSINIEHPFTVLYRERHASFLSNEVAVRKIGTATGDSILPISILPLHNNDKIITGSDGRDDVLLNSNNGLVRNEERELFLRWVSQSGGDVQLIGESIEQNSIVKDDMSILGIQYNKPKYQFKISDQLASLLSEDQIGELKKSTNLKAFCRKLNEFVETAIAENETNLASQLGYELYLKEPLNLQNIQRLTEIYSDLQEFNNAKNLSDTLVARDPANTVNILASAQLYRKMDELAAAKRLASIALNLDPDLTGASEILKL